MKVGLTASPKLLLGFAISAALFGATADALAVTGCACSFANVAVVSAKQAWAAPGGANLTARWNGRRWVSVRVPRSAGSRATYLHGVSGTSPGDVWTVGTVFYLGPGGGTFRPAIFHWVGRRWTRVTAPDPTGRATSSGSCVACARTELFGVDAVSPSDAWAVGAYRKPTPVPGPSPRSFGVPQLFILHWDGHTWSQAAHNLPGAGLTAVSEAFSTDVWAVGEAGNGQNRTVTVHWDGSSWTRVSSPNPAGVGNRTVNELHSVAAISPTDAWAVGQYQHCVCRSTSKTMLLHWNGSAWTRVHSPNPGGPSNLNDLYGVVAASATDVWAVGDYWRHRERFPLVLHWDGSRWSRLRPPFRALGHNAFAHALLNASGPSGSP